MRSALNLSSLNDDRRALLRRIAILLIVFLVHILGVLGLIMLAPEYIKLIKKPEPTVFTLEDPSNKPNRQKQQRNKVEKTKAAKAATPAPPQPEKPPPLNMVMMDAKTFAASDIGALPHQAVAAAEPAEDSGSPGGQGTGPNGERLYKAEWYREPTQAELSTYFSKTRVRVGYGVIACRTVAGFRVEDCREIEEAPMGSGFARAAREASWQFRVRPPTRGGKPLVGSWVSIAIEMRENGAELRR